MSNVLQDIFKDHYEEMLYILHPRKSVIENVDRMINCGDPSLVVQCMVVLNVVLSNSFLSDVIVVSVLSVEPSTPLTALPLCLLR